ncbi:MAG TPA: glycine--tRNA ligase subunit beta [Sutterella sp.]|nr:glycine--tRNA ligase subunit beta [Sutterella sp.]
MTSLLVELQTEELPPKALKKLSEAFADGVAKALAAQHLLSADSVTTGFGAPRRMAVLITNVLAKAPDEAFRQKLVPVRVGLTAEGEAAPALVKKMAALGITCPVSELKRVNDGKNEQLVYEGVKMGVELAAGLQKALEDAVKALPIPRVMNYQLADGHTTVQFVRPVKHLTALYGEEIVPVAMFGLKADRITMGHRFHTKHPIAIRSADGYAEQLKSEGKVIASYPERRARLVELLKAEADRQGGTLIAPEDLIDETNSLTEWPVIYTSGFEQKFLAVPEECLILTMQTNQKYFPMRDAAGKLMNKFCLVSHLEAKDGGEAIRSGNARVVRARLADAEFFYTQDCQQTLESRVPGLEHVVYHNKLGSQAARMLRVKALAGMIAGLIGADAAKAERAAMLAKADLRTLMVGEFPELQGIMGEYYARNDGEPEEVAKAVSEHYAPRFAGDALPSTPVSIAVALADKLETLTGMFGIGQMPTGDKDPFALRRHALGVLRMLIEKKLDVSLRGLIERAFAIECGVAGLKDETESLLGFFFDRLRVMMREHGYSAQEVDAVLAKRNNCVLDTPVRLAAVKSFMALPEAESLTAANKRIANILKKIEGEVSDEVNEALFAEPAEKALFAAMKACEPAVKQAYEAGRFEDVLRALTSLKAPVDAFFADVMVNADDPAVRANRQALLKRLYTLMNSVAELSRLAK